MHSTQALSKRGKKRLFMTLLSTDIQYSIQVREGKGGRKQYSQETK
jgi:hypothetical protein